MDPFTENILTRARERQRLLEATTPRKGDFKEDFKASNASNALRASDSPKAKACERFLPTQNVPSPTKTLNIRQSDFDMEIKVTSKEDVHVEVHIQEQEQEEPAPKRGLRKLAALAQNMNEWEDDVKTTKKPAEKPVKKWKAPAPQPPQNSPMKPKAPQPPQPAKSVKWDKQVLDSLESQGFTRTDSNSKLIYKYDQENAPDKGIVANKAAIFESAATNSPKIVQKDPSLLSVAERKALFERNKGDAPVPRAPFAMATTPVKQAHTTSQVPVVKTTPKQSVVSRPAVEEEIVAMVTSPRQREVDEHMGEEVDCQNGRVENRRSSGNKRNSTSDSPKVAAVLNDVKRIKVTKKPGRLYPSLTDIESQTETENETRSPTPANSSYEESDENNVSCGTSYSFSFERPEPNPSSSESRPRISEQRPRVSEHHPRVSETRPSASEAYSGASEAYSSASEQRPSAAEHQTTSPDLPTHLIDGDTIVPLTHTVSFYRKQQQEQKILNTQFKQMARKAVLMEHNDEEEEEASEEREVDAKIKMLEAELPKQEAIISQTSQALNLCNATPEFVGSTEQVEAERVLLVAAHRRQSAVQELQRLRVERTLHPRVSVSNSSSSTIRSISTLGTLTITKIVLPLKEKYVTALAATGGKGHHVVCLIKHNDRVIPTQLVSTVASTNRKNPDCDLSIPGTITLDNVPTNCAFTFEVYCLQAQEEQLPHDVKYHIRKNGGGGGGLLTPKKKTTIKFKLGAGSPAGPMAVRTPTFALMGYAIVQTSHQHKQRSWTLNNAPSMSPLDGAVEMCLKFERAPVHTEHRGFLTMFEDVSGFGAWHRRWCLLQQNTLSYWKYPDDERKQAPINTIDLTMCKTRKVGPVSRDICARLHTLLLEVEREAREDDRDSLVTMRNGNRTIVRHLLSADTKEERVEWCEKLNEVLEAIEH